MNDAMGQESGASAPRCGDAPARRRLRLGSSGRRAALAALVSAAAVALLAATMPLAVAADTQPSSGPPTSTPVSPSEPQESGTAFQADGPAPQAAQAARGPGIFQSFGFVFLGRPGDVQAGFDRYYWMTAAGLGVTAERTGSINPRGHCTWAEYYWALTSTSGDSYLSGDNVPMYFDFNTRTVWLIFGADAPVRSGNWSGSQAGGSATVAVTCAVHEVFRIDDWPPSEVHDDVWYDVKVCEGSLPDMIEAGGTASIPVAPAEFDVRVLVGSDPISRAGHYTELALELTKPTGAFIYRGSAEPIPITVPVANAPFGGSVILGPSAGAQIMCLTPPTVDVPDPGYSNVCTTDPDGHITVRYLVPTDAAHLLQRGQDTLSVFIDHDQDRTRDHSPGQPNHEPAAALDIDIAKTINYVALGDSYSSGEAGELAGDGSEGAYENDTPQADSPSADEHCRRWNLAYPYILASDILGGELDSTVAFATFACTGAVTHNIHDPRRIGDGVDEQDLVDTNKPSHFVPSLQYDADTNELLSRPSGWEPRQGVSLAGVQAVSGVDMVTLTIGGNDADFGRGVLVCALVSRCDPALSAERLVEIENRVVAVLAEVRRVAPDAVVFVLGYPYLTPQVDPCANPKEIQTHRPGHSPTIELDFSALAAGCEAMWNMYRPGVDECGPLSSTGVVRGSLFYVLGAALQVALGSDRTRIDYWEAKAMWVAADALNAAVRSAARRAGAHFVDVVGGVPLDDAPQGFRDRFSCNPHESWVNGFVAKQGLRLDASGADGSSFHPTDEGHDAYARILEAYIRSRVAAGAELSGAGLPLAPVPTSGASTDAGSQRSAAGSAGGTGGHGGGQAEATSATPSTGLLVPRAATSVSGCGAAFVSPGGQVTLAAAGFATDAAVTFNAQAASLGTAQLTAPQLDAATADSDGMLSTAWTVPTAPAASVDPAPRAYLIDAAGLNTSGGTHTALMGLPVVAYPATAPCAVADTASTTLGQPVTVSVLANDVAPTDGSLDAALILVREATGGAFAVDGTTGAVTFTPDPGFWGTVETTYVVYDGWGIGVEADLTVTVDGGCTVTGTEGTALIEGTDGDDVICVPDRDDHRAFHIIDGKSGDDIVLGGAGVEWVYGGDGVDVIYGNGGDDRIVAGSGVDTVHGGSGMDSIYSLDTSDTVVDNDYALVLAPAATVPQLGPAAEDDWAWVDISATVQIDVLGNDHDPNGDLDSSTLTVTSAPASGTAEVTEQAGSRTVVSYSSPAGGGTVSFGYEVCDSLGSCAEAAVTVMVGTTGCTIVGTAGDDRLRGTADDDVICGLGGNDLIHGLGGDDVIVGGAGHDLVYGGDPAADGDDGADLIWGGAGDDTLLGSAGADRLWGGIGDDALYGEAGDDAMQGGLGADRISGGPGADRLWGGAGDDVLWGLADADIAWGGRGDDMMWGGYGDDVLWGGPGSDALYGGLGADRVHGGAGNDELSGHAGDDALWGGPGDDTIWGHDDADELHGDSGDDTLHGGAGTDRLWGGIDADTLDGGYGIDHLDGGAGTDTCQRAGTAARCE